MLKKDLETKNRELATSVMYLLQKNNLMHNLNEKMKKAILPLNPESKKPIQDLIREADMNLSNDTWDDFETRFKNVHTDFYDKLIKDFPELSPNELKLCAFLKLNMTTKDIATITFQSINSLTEARHRLRSKMGLDRDENLITFLAKY